MIGITRTAQNDPAVTLHDTGTVTVSVPVGIAGEVRALITRANVQDPVVKQAVVEVQKSIS